MCSSEDFGVLCSSTGLDILWSSYELGVLCSSTGSADVCERSTLAFLKFHTKNTCLPNRFIAYLSCLCCSYLLFFYLSCLGNTDKDLDGGVSGEPLPL